ncbi:hypothetical protein GO986_12010 [Deinococcus sp. HMF7620]|uniref:Uncharacterized protein n=1 Tax=Deinococcus arboris TaxID=2682977 RepID=A0A7C9HS36_9DEIO|nr:MULTISPECIES: hypothetical protein [Deinococcus]MBZ9752159.1 hypothetical protein [Deinococcus betulae]MVN87489.1 hypothetical protein [Deinococcus arboris]
MTRTADTWHALPQVTRHLAHSIASLTDQLSRAPSAEELSETLSDPPDLPTTMVHLQSLMDGHFVQHSCGSYQVHPETLRLLASEPWPSPPLPVLKNNRPHEGHSTELVPWWYGDTVRIIQDTDDFQVLGAVAGDIVVLRTVQDGAEGCFTQAFHYPEGGSTLKPWTADRTNFDLVVLIVAHLRPLHTAP